MTKHFDLLQLDCLSYLLQVTYISFIIILTDTNLLHTQGINFDAIHCYLQVCSITNYVILERIVCYFRFMLF